MKAIDKAILFLLVVISIVSDAQAQNSVTAQFSGRIIGTKGGFVHSVPSKQLRGAVGLCFDHKDSALIGYSFHFSNGIKDFTYQYPYIFGRSAIDGTPEFFVAEYVTPSQGMTFRYYELFAGATLFYKKSLRVKLGPYMSFNSSIPNEHKVNDIDSGYYFPYTADGLYRKIELGAQLHLNYHIHLGEHFFLSLNGMTGMSLLDLCKNKWEHAYQRVWIYGTMSESDLYHVHMESKRASVYVYSVGLGIGYTW